MINDSTIYVSGEFNTIGGQDRNSFDIVDTAGNVLPWHPVAGYVPNMVVADEAIYLGGSFSTLNGQQTHRNLAGFALPPAPKLELTKSVNDPTPQPGQVITYTLTIHNSGNLTATSALISDTLDNNLTFAGPVAIQGSSGTPGDAGTLPLIAGGLTINPDSTITVTFPVTVNSLASPDAVITNTASTTSTEITAPVSGQVALTVTAQTGQPATFLPVLFYQK